MPAPAGATITRDGHPPILLGITGALVGVTAIACLFQARGSLAQLLDGYHNGARPPFRSSTMQGRLWALRLRVLRVLAAVSASAGLICFAMAPVLYATEVPVNCSDLLSAGLGMLLMHRSAIFGINVLKARQIRSTTSSLGQIDNFALFLSVSLPVGIITDACIGTFLSRPISSDTCTVQFDWYWSLGIYSCDFIQSTMSVYLLTLPLRKHVADMESRSDNLASRSDDIRNVISSNMRSFLWARLSFALLMGSLICIGLGVFNSPIIQNCPLWLAGIDCNVQLFGMQLSSVRMTSNSRLGSYSPRAIADAFIASHSFRRFSSPWRFYSDSTNPAAVDPEVPDIEGTGSGDKVIDVDIVRSNVPDRQEDLDLD